VIVARRYRGPAQSGNGGYSCGLFAQLLDGDAEVTLRSPPPLDTPLRVDGLEIWDGDTLVADVRPTAVELELPEPPSRVVAGEPDPDHPFPTCFVCGPARTDGLRLLPRAYGDVVAAPWRPAEVSRELVWAALDCPGAFAVNPGFDRGVTVLGRLAVHIEELPREGDDLVVVGWDLGGSDGRRFYAGTSLFRGKTPLAWGRATWFSVRDVLREPLPSRR
jgi:hypothetical protein